MLDLNRFDESPHLLDLLIQMEDVLDSLDLYVFKNWFKGEVVEGPTIQRYWLGVTLRFSLEHMPDPRGAKRLLKQQIIPEYEKVTVSDQPSEEAEESGPTHWQVKLQIPRRLVADMNAAELDFYDQDIDVDDVQDAQDSGITDETSYGSEEAEEDPNAAPDPAAEGGTDAVQF
jgi:hypothetical protein